MTKLTLSEALWSEAGFGKIKKSWAEIWEARPCLTGFVYHYSNHFTAPRHVNLIDTVAFPRNPRPHQPRKKKQKKKHNKCNSIAYFPPRLCGLAPPQGTSRHWIHSVIYNWLLCPKCCFGPTQSKWTVSKTSLSLVITPPPPASNTLHNCSKPSTKKSSEHAPEVHPLIHRPKRVFLSLPVASLIEYL